MKNSSGASRARILRSDRAAPALSGPIIIPILLFIACAAMAGTVHATENSIVRLDFMDVGYGDALLIELPGQKFIMVDAGERINAGQVNNFLQSRQVNALNTVIITHPHENHFGGFFDIMEAYPIGRAFINGDRNAEEGYGQLLELFNARDIPVMVLKRGDVIDGLAEGVSIRVLHPQSLSGSPNDNSLVMWFTHGAVSMLLTGDIEEDGQREIVSGAVEIRRASLVKVPHHGGPLSDVFIQALEGKTFIVSTGDNPWGLPRAQELAQLKGKVYRTDRDGTITAVSDGRQVIVRINRGK